MKKLLIILILGSTITMSNAQNISKDKINTDFIDNCKIKYSIGLASCDSCFPVHSIGYRIVTTLTEEQETIVNKLSYKEWLSLLSNKKSDWAANLILYYVIGKDAIPLYSIKTRKEWLINMKSQDLVYWEQNLDSLLLSHH